MALALALALHFIMRSPFNAAAAAASSLSHAARPFSHFIRNYAGTKMPPRLVINEAEIDEKFLKGSGPGGQKINKTSSAVQLKHLPSGMVVKSQATRSQSQNRKIARRILAEKLDENENGPESRTALKLQAIRKKKANRRKKARKKYGNLTGKGADEVASEDDVTKLNTDHHGKAS